MKIIARIDSGKLLVEMTEREIAHVSGHNTESEMNTKRHGDPFMTGTEYAVSPAWRRLQEQATAADRLEGVSRTLTALADLVKQTKVQFTNCTAATPEGQQ